ncbi:uncharacterized protein TNCV_4734201 [Trichonephila clavipes]|nr:uncharacterized protein TNCV_4734201 [Trichonephila clavipes]
MSWIFRWVLMVLWIYLVPSRCSPVSSCAVPLQTEASMGGCQGQHTLWALQSQMSFSQAPSYGSRRRRASSEGATCAWMVADEAVGRTRAFLTMWWSSRWLVCRGRPEPGLRVNDISRIHCSPHLLTTQSERTN